jgi:hypothetical protein
MYISDAANMHIRQIVLFTRIAAGLSKLSGRQLSTMIVVVR